MPAIKIVNSTKTTLLIFIMALSLFLNGALLYLYHTPTPKGLLGDEGSYIKRTTQLYGGETVEFNPLWPPGYEYFLGGSYYLADLFSVENQILFAQLVQIVLWAIGAFLFWKILEETVAEDWSKLIAFALFMLYPTYIAFSHYFWPEIPHLTLCIAILWILICKPPTLTWHILLAICTGFAVLLKLVYLPLAFVIFAWLFFKAWQQSRPFGFPAAATLVFVLVLSPTLYRNYQQHDQMMLADSSIFNIWVGLNDIDLTDRGANRIAGPEFRTYMASAPTHKERQQIYREKIEEFVVAQGVQATLIDQLSKQYLRLFNYKTFFTTQLPGGEKERYTFESAAVVRSITIFDSAIWVLILVGSGIGSMQVFKRPISWLHLFALIIAYNLGLFLFLHSKTRYVLQFLPFLCVFAGMGLNTLSQLVFQPKRYWPQYTAAAKAAVLAGGLLSIGLVAISFYTL